MAKNTEITKEKTYEFNYRGSVAIGIAETFSETECVIKTEKGFLVVNRSDVIKEASLRKTIGKNMAIWEHENGGVLLTSDFSEDGPLAKRGWTKIAVKYIETTYTNGEGL